MTNPGRVISITPPKPASSAPVRRQPSFSPKNGTASTVIHSGLVKVIATACASGSAMKAKTEKKIAPSTLIALHRCSPGRFVFSASRMSPAMNGRIDSSPKAQRKKVICRLW